MMISESNTICCLKTDDGNLKHSFTTFVTNLSEQEVKSKNQF